MGFDGKENVNKDLVLSLSLLKDLNTYKEKISTARS